MNEKIILYGGMFNPPTKAHQKIIAYLRDKYPTKTIVLLPANDHYDKHNNEGSITHVKKEERLKMLKIISKDYKNVKVSDYEFKDKTYKGSYYTLKHFDNPYFVIGTDQLEKLPTWINAHELIKENKFIVFPRMGFKAENILSNSFFDNYQANITIVNDYDENDISSTDFRQNFNSDIIDERVLKYINKKGLYR